MSSAGDNTGLTGITSPIELLLLWVGVFLKNIVLRLLPGKSCARSGVFESLSAKSRWWLDFPQMDLSLIVRWICDLICNSDNDSRIQISATHAESLTGDVNVLTQASWPGLALILETGWAGENEECVILPLVRATECFTAEGSGPEPGYSKRRT